MTIYLSLCNVFIAVKHSQQNHNEIKVEEKKDETIKNLLSTALSGLDLDDEESENLSDIISKPEPNPPADQANNQLYYKKWVRFI